MAPHQQYPLTGSCSHFHIPLYNKHKKLVSLSDFKQCILFIPHPSQLDTQRNTGQEFTYIFLLKKKKLADFSVVISWSDGTKGLSLGISLLASYEGYPEGKPSYPLMQGLQLLDSELFDNSDIGRFGW